MSNTLKYILFLHIFLNPTCLAYSIIICLSSMKPAKAYSGFNNPISRNTSCYSVLNLHFSFLLKTVIPNNPKML